MNLEIRHAKENEMDILLDFEKGIVEAERPYDTTLKDGEIHYYDLAALVQSPNAAVLVAVANDEIVGSGYAKIQQGEPYQKFTAYAYLGFMYVKPKFRSKGINKLLLKGLIDWARSKEITELRLEVYDENCIAKTAYSKAGFKANLLKMRMEI
ncbi:MAG: GNAT family N-acetyltransferase [Agriterribacter sp.]